MKCKGCNFDDVGLFRWLFKSRVCKQCAYWLIETIYEEKKKRYAKWEKEVLKDK